MGELEGIQQRGSIISHLERVDSWNNCLERQCMLMETRDNWTEISGSMRYNLLTVAVVT